MTTVEDNKDPVGVFGVDSDPVVPDRKDPLAVLPLGRAVDPRRLAAPVLDGVADQILEQLEQL